MAAAKSSPDATGAHTSLRWIALLVGIVAAEGLALGWCLLRPKATSAFATGKEIAERFQEANLVRHAYPDVNFQAIYPGRTTDEIDYLQRECGTLRYVYAPFVEFRHLPFKGRFVEVTPAGFRGGSNPQPWPPGPNDYPIFVLGGSTTFGYGAFSDQTIVTFLQRELNSRFPESHIQCYNFGSVSYISSQERALFEVLSMHGVVPKATIFIDGLNDFYYPDGQPQLTPILFRLVTPDLTLPTPSLRTEEERSRVVDGLLSRYERNLRLTESLAAGLGVKAVFIGQPTPFVDFPSNPKTYPFDQQRTGHDLCRWGYSRFKDLATSGVLGKNFIWCGDAFSHADSVMYADGVHYSSEGARVLAKAIADRSILAGLLP